MKILVLGATGMIGNIVFKMLSLNYEVWGTIRSPMGKVFFSDALQQRLISGIDVLEKDLLTDLINKLNPDVVINCIGLTKHLKGSEDSLLSKKINSLYPHRLVSICSIVGARLIHISTDCVFSGRKGNYSEQDSSDAEDIYGKSKFLGEVNCQGAITLRTSTIGHELSSSYGLLNWFLSQDEECRGFSQAIFSGVTTVELARVIRDIVIPRTDLSGLYQLSGRPISKYELLKIISKVYKKPINIIEDAHFVIDRSLNPIKFNDATGYLVNDWYELITLMYINFIEKE